MTLFLRNKNNRSIVDIEVTKGTKGIDIHSIVIIKYYSELLIGNIEKKDEIISDFSEISELRGWFWEVYMEQNDEPTLTEVLSELRTLLMPVAKKYNLSYVED